MVSAFVLPLPIEVGTDVEFDLQITLPYTVVFPDVFGRRRRSVPDPQQNFDTLTKHGASLSKLNSLFQSAGIMDVECQMRLFCKIHSDPRKYATLGDAVLKHMDVRNGVQEVGNEISQLYNQYWEAGKVGLNPEGNCTRLTEKCEKDPDEHIDWLWLNIIQSVKHLTGIIFK